jgi:transcriptional regulator with GAF, ATPase, and Fis domain
MSTQFVQANGQTNSALAPNHSDSAATNKTKSFSERVHDLEHEIIAEALEATEGSVTQAARKLGLTHQGLCYIINHRHKELLAARRPIRIRRRSIIPKDKLRRRPK